MSIIPQIIGNSIIAGSLYTLLALGFNLIYGTVKFFDLGYGVLTAVGGYTVFGLAKLLGLNLYLAIVLGVAFAGFLNFLIYRLVYVPLRRKKASNLVLLVASLGVFTVLQALIAILFGNQFQTLSSGSARSFEILSATLTSTQLVIFLLGALIFGSLLFLIKKTKIGKIIRAIGDDEEVTKIIGINTEKIVSYVFVFGGVIAGLSGILVGFDTGIEPVMGMNLLMKGVIASIIGGVGNIYGGVLGAFLLGFVENFGVWQISGEWKDAIAFGLLILFLIFRPKGIIEN